MAFNHRKLISASENKDIIIPDACEFFCDSTRNTQGYCTSTCTPLCPLVCINPISSLIFPSPPPPAAAQEKNPKLPLLLIISLSFLAAVCFLFCCYTIYKSYKIWEESRTRRRRRSADAQQEESYSQFFDQDHGPVVDHPIWYIRTVGLQSSVINSIAICKYKRGDGLVEGTDCSVCLAEFREDEALRLLPKCNHAFHIPCIDTWLRSHTNCPLCRARIVSNPAGIPTVAPEQSVNNPGVREENPVVDSESRGEFRREREDGDCELVGIEEEGEREGGNFEKNLVFPEEEVVHQPMRRSVSMDSVSASMISLAIANAYSAETVGNSGSPMGIHNKSNAVTDPKRVDANRSLLKLVGDSSIGRSPQKGAISMKRSLSCSGNVLFSKYARSWNSILPS